MEMIIKHLSEISEVPHPKFENVFIRQLATTAETERLSASIVRIMPNATLSPHVHDVMEMFYMLRGEGEAFIEEEKKIVTEGNLIIAPPGKVHGMKNIGESDILLYAVFSPGIA